MDKKNNFHELKKWKATLTEISLKSYLKQTRGINQRSKTNRQLSLKFEDKKFENVKKFVIAIVIVSKEHQETYKKLFDEVSENKGST